MKLSSVVKAFGSLCLVMLVDGAAVPMAGPPRIIGRDDVRIKAHPGKPLILHCDAFTNSQDGVTLIYWLVNGVFPEDTTDDGRIVELDKLSLENGTILQRAIMLNDVTCNDLNSTFTCVVTNAVGVAEKHVKLTIAGCSGTRKRKNKSDHLST